MSAADSPKSIRPHGPDPRLAGHRPHCRCRPLWRPSSVTSTIPGARRSAATSSIRCPLICSTPVALAISKMHPRALRRRHPLPLSVSLHRSASRLVAALGKVASGYGEVLAEVQHRPSDDARRNPKSSAPRPSGNPRRATDHRPPGPATVRLSSSGSDPRLFPGRSRRITPADAKGGGVPRQTLKAYKYLLAFVAAQPEGLTSAEISWLSEYSRPTPRHVTIRHSVPSDPGHGWLWIDLDQDAPPVSINRRDLPASTAWIDFTAEELARRTTSLIEQLEGEAPGPRAFPPACPVRQQQRCSGAFENTGRPSAPRARTAPQPVRRQRLQRPRDHLEDACANRNGPQNRYASNGWSLTKADRLCRDAGDRDGQII